MNRVLMRFAVRLVLPALVVVGLANLLLPDLDPRDSAKFIAAAEASGNFLTAEQAYRGLIESDVLNLTNHRGYIRNHFNSPKRFGKREIRDDARIRREYEAYAEDSRPDVADIGWYGLGFIHASSDDWSAAVDAYHRVRDRRMTFLNNSLGFALEKLGHLESAEAAFRAEIEGGGYASGAYLNLGNLLLRERRFGALDRLAEDPGTRPFLSARAVRFHLLRHGRLLDYAAGLPAFRQLTIAGLLASIAIAAVWLLYLRRVDVFEPERPAHALAVFASGILFSLLAIPLYDFADFALQFRLTGDYWNDLAFCVLGIGLTEEAIKIAPVLLFLGFARFINESIDYVVYGSLSALGFAFSENLLYFSDSGLDEVSARGFSATVFHMFLTSLVMYSFVASRGTRRAQRLGWLAAYFGAACILHGVYDFFLVAEGWVGELSVFSFLILVLGVSRFGRVINNALNQSELNLGKPTDLVDLTEILSYSLGAIITLQYMLLAFKFGPTNANRDFAWTLLTSWFLLFVILVSLGHILVVKGRWLPLLRNRE